MERKRPPSESLDAQPQPQPLQPPINRLVVENNTDTYRRLMIRFNPDLQRITTGMREYERYQRPRLTRFIGPSGLVMHAESATENGDPVDVHVDVLSLDGRALFRRDIQFAQVFLSVIFGWPAAPVIRTRDTWHVRCDVARFIRELGLDMISPPPTFNFGHTLVFGSERESGTTPMSAHLRENYARLAIDEPDALVNWIGMAACTTLLFATVGITHRDFTLERMALRPLVRGVAYHVGANKVANFAASDCASLQLVVDDTSSLSMVAQSTAKYDLYRHTKRGAYVIAALQSPSSTAQFNISEPDPGHDCVTLALSLALAFAEHRVRPHRRVLDATIALLPRKEDMQAVAAEGDRTSLRVFVATEFLRLVDRLNDTRLLPDEWAVALYGHVAAVLKSRDTAVNGNNYPPLGPLFTGNPGDRVLVTWSAAPQEGFSHVIRA